MLFRLVMRSLLASTSVVVSLAVLVGCSKSESGGGGSGGAQPAASAPVVGSTKPAPPMASQGLEPAKKVAITKEDGLLCDPATTDALQCEESFGPAGRCIMAAGDKGAASLKAKGCSEQTKVKGAFCCPQP